MEKLEIEAIFKKTKEDLEKNIKQEITPIEYIDKNRLSKDEKELMIDIGKKIIEDNKYAIITMAGGQGTRLGFNGPKGAYKLNIGNESKYIFEILTEIMLEAKQKYGNLPYWYIMTSIQNNDATIKLFEENNYFGYEKQKVAFFKQEEIPMLTEEGIMAIGEDGNPKMAANGNGGLYQAAKKSGVIDEMKNNGVEWVYICSVDNIMAKPIDPLFIGLTISNKMPMASKSIVKAYPEEKIGVYCKRDGKPGIVEYTELTDVMVNLRDEDR